MNVILYLFYSVCKQLIKYFIEAIFDSYYTNYYRIKMPKSKKKSGKLSKMTEEERMAYLEQQRLAEEEMRKKKEDMLTQFLKVSLFYNDTRLSIDLILT